MTKKDTINQNPKIIGWLVFIALLIGLYLLLGVFMGKLILFAKFHTWPAFLSLAFLTLIFVGIVVWSLDEKKN